MKPFALTLFLTIAAHFNLYAGDLFREVHVGADSWEVVFHEQGGRYRMEIDSMERGTSGYLQRLRLLPKETLRLVDKHWHEDIKPAERAGKPGVEITRSYHDRFTGEQKTESTFEPNHPAQTTQPGQSDGEQQVDRIAPRVESIDPEELLPALHAKENFRAYATTIRRGLVGSQLTYRAKSAQWFIEHGTVEDVPYLIDALSDESMHVGARYPQAGMATTRYWANVALIVICKTSYDFQWNAPKEKRAYSIMLWKQHWKRIQAKNQK